MYIPALFSWVFCCVCCHVVFCSKTHYSINQVGVGSGVTLQNLSHVSILSCSRACSREKRCNAATYFPGNQTCALLQDGVMNSEETPEGLYLGQSSEGQFNHVYCEGKPTNCHGKEFMTVKDVCYY